MSWAQAQHTKVADTMNASAIIQNILFDLKGLPVFLCGSLVAEEAYGLSDAHNDADIFCSSEPALFVTVQHLLAAGYVLGERDHRVWHRWVRYGFRQWHTNSIRLESPAGVEVNVVYKTVGKQPLRTLSQVLESFDFGLLAVGYEAEDGTFRDFRPVLFPGYDIDGPLPLMPNKRADWVDGYISKYNGLRMPGRYARYAEYGYDMSLIKDDLVSGYLISAEHYKDHVKEEMRFLNDAYTRIAEMIEADEHDELMAATKIITNLDLDAYDQIMEALQ